MRLIRIILLLVTCAFLPAAQAAETLFYKEINLIGGYSDKNKWIGKSSDLMNSVGFEHFAKFSNEYGDFLTTDFQVRLGYDSKEGPENAWGLEVHNAWLQYRLSSMNKIKVGHFDPAFGLEQVLDTHSTILQTLAPKNIGFKKDWGLALEGTLPKADYSLALQLGSGMSIYRRDGSFLTSGRIGTPQGENVQAGFSLMYGDVLKTEGMSTYPRNELISNKATKKKRVGFDAQYLFGALLTKAEVAFGKDERKDVLGYLLEFDYTIPRLQNCELELQYQSWNADRHTGGMDDSTLTLGATYKLTARTALRAAFAQDLNLGDGNEDKIFLVQFYYYGQ